jgi:O-antigen ligase
MQTTDQPITLSANMFRQPTLTGLRDWFTGLLVAAPIIVFPFSRTHTVFFITILIYACVYWRNLILPRSHRPLLLGIAAITVPILITGLALPLLGNAWSFLSLKKLGTVLLAGVFGLATMILIKEQPGSMRITKSTISLTVLFWIADGVIQLIFGQDLFGVPLNYGRVSIFATNPLDFAYYFPLFAVFPITHFYGLPEKAKSKLPVKTISFLLLIFSIIVSFSGGCRNSMLLICIVALGWVAIFARDTSFRYRRLLIPMFSGLLIILSAAFYNLNEVFQQRADQTMKIVIAPSYQQVNEVLSKRLDIWQPAMEIIHKNILFGIGPNQFRATVLNILKPGNYFYQNSDFITHSHQVLIEVSLGTGIIGLACFLLYYIYTARYLFVHRGLLEDQKGFGLAGTLAFLLMWMPLGTHYNVYGSMQLFYSFYFLGLGFAVCPETTDNQTRSY